MLISYILADARSFPVYSVAGPWWGPVATAWRVLRLRMEDRPYTWTVASNTEYTQKNGAVSKVNKKSISHLTWAQSTPSAAAAATAQVSHALLAVRFSCLLRGRGASSQDGVAAGKGFLCAPF